MSGVDTRTTTGLHGLDEEAAASLLRAVTSARWFAGKGRRSELRSLTPLPWLNDPAPPVEGEPEVPRVRLAVLEVAYPDEAGVRPGADADEGTPGEVEDSDPGFQPAKPAARGVEHYQLALAYRTRPAPAYASAELFTDGDATVYDATQDVGGARVLLDALLDQRDVGQGDPDSDEDEISSVRFHLRDVAGLSRELVPQVFRGQQSNTSVMFGDVAILKLFRRLELGRNLDVQVHAALNDAGVDDVAQLYGWCEGTWTSGGEVLGADLSMCVEKLADAVDGWDLALASLEADTRRATATARDDEPEFAHHAHALGRALAQTHDALRTAFGATDQPGAAVTGVMSQRLTAAVAVAPALEPYAAGLEARFAALADVHLDAQRVHGDFHLGQTLHTPSGWKIIDFEGEPAKSIAERVAPDSVWRDVAGMMRSFDYAAASVPGAVGTSWRDACRDAFVDGYTDGAGLAPDDAGLLAAYEADKAVYEVVYEVRNRPDWVGIPLGAVAALAAPTPQPETPENEELP